MKKTIKNHLYLSSSLILSLFAPLPSSTAMDAPKAMEMEEPRGSEKANLKYVELMSLFEHYPIKIEDITEARGQATKGIPNLAAYGEYMAVMDKTLLNIPEFKKFFIRALEIVKDSELFENSPLTTEIVRAHSEKIDSLFKQKFLSLYEMTQDDLQQTRLASAFSKLYFISFITYIRQGFYNRGMTNLFPALLCDIKNKKIPFAQFLLSSPTINMLYDHLHSEGITRRVLNKPTYYNALDSLQVEWNNAFGIPAKKYRYRCSTGVVNKKRKRQEEEVRQQPNVQTQPTQPAPARPSAIQHNVAVNGQAIRGQAQLPQPDNKRLKLPPLPPQAQPMGRGVPAQPLPAGQPPVPQHAAVQGQVIGGQAASNLIIPANTDPRVVQYYNNAQKIKRLADLLRLRAILIKEIEKASKNQDQAKATRLQGNLQLVEKEIVWRRPLLEKDTAEHQSLKDIIFKDSTLMAQYERLCMAQKGNTAPPQQAPLPAPIIPQLNDQQLFPGAVAAPRGVPPLPKAAAVPPAPRPQPLPGVAVPPLPKAAAVPPAPRPQPLPGVVVPPAAVQQIQGLGAPQKAATAATIASNIQRAVTAKGEVFFINKSNNTRFYGDPSQALSANAQQRQELREITEHLLRLSFSKKISQENFAIASNVIDVIGTALKENNQICHNLYNQFMKSTNYLQYSNDPRIILHFELSDMQAQDRIPAIYNTLNLAYKFALEHSLLEDFFTHAFLERVEGYGCLDAAQKFIINWLEMTMEKIKRRTEINMQPEPATEDIIYRTIQEVYEAAKVQAKLDCLGGRTFAQYEQELRRNYSGAEQGELTLKIEEAKSKMIASLKEALKAKVSEQLEVLNYIPDAALIEQCWQTIFTE